MGQLAMFVRTSAFLFGPSVFLVMPSSIRVPGNEGGGKDGIIVLVFLLRPKAEWRTMTIATARFSNEIINLPLDPTTKWQSIHTSHSDRQSK
jgi:hypothetical protein